MTKTFLFNGLLKAQRDCAREAGLFCLEMIAADGKSVPNHQHEWKIGATHSWHYVRIVEYRNRQLIDYLEGLPLMAKAKRKNTGNGLEKYSFVRCELTSEDKKAAKIWVEANSAEFGALLHDAVASGYKYSLSFSSEHDTFTACFTGKEEHGFNAYKTLTARHKDWLVAALTLLYKSTVMFKNGVWETDDDDDDDGWA